MEYLDIVNEAGQPTGRTVAREIAHRDGILHRTAHVWIVREKAGRTEILLQKRSEEKESFPGMYDTSSAGHIPAGEEPLASAIRELHEELGIDAAPEELRFAGMFRIRYEKEFHNRLFRDNEVTSVYVYDHPVKTDSLCLQESEVSEVRWFPLEEVWEEIHRSRERFCVPAEGLAVLREALSRRRRELRETVQENNHPKNVSIQEENMIINEAVLRGILDAYPYEIVFVDRTHIVRYLNKTAERRYGGIVRVGNSIFNCHNESTKPKIEEFLRRADAGEDEMFETLNQRTGEREFFVPVRGEDGGVIGYFERHEVPWDREHAEEPVGDYWKK